MVARRKRTDGKKKTCQTECVVFVFILHYLWFKPSDREFLSFYWTVRLEIGSHKPPALFAMDVWKGSSRPITSTLILGVFIFIIPSMEE